MPVRPFLARSQKLASRALKSLRYRQVKVDEPIHIDSLISPLRYDVIVRKEYFQFFREHRRTFEQNNSEFFRMARETSYYRWFRDIVWERSAPELLDDDDALEAAFRKRLRSCAALHDSYHQRGFDAKQPIKLRAGRVTLPTESGKRVMRGVYTGGGCHRIALLILDGVRELPAEWVRVTVFDTYSPLDNTFRLISSLRMSPSTYYRFVSLGYAERPFETREELRAHVERTAPARLAELDHVLAVDEPVLRTVPPFVPR